MKLRILMAIFALSACQAEPASPSAGAPQEEAETGRVFAPGNAAAETATGELNVVFSTRMPERAGDDAQETVTMRAAKGLVVEARLANQVALATEVQGRTLRGLLDLPVEEQQTFVYRVASETHPEGVSGMCGEGAAEYVVVWEPSTPSSSGLKLLGFTGGAPGAASARACPMLEYVQR